MGCGTSKIDDLPLVTLCRQRRDLIRAAADDRYALAAAHVSYFRSLAAVGDALCKFVDEELLFGADSGSSPGSPVLTLPSDEGKRGKTGEGKGKGNRKHKVLSSSSTSISHSVSRDLHEDGDNGGSHLNLSDSDSELSSGSGHIHLHDDGSNKGEVGVGRDDDDDDDDGVGPSGYGYDFGGYGAPSMNRNTFDQYGSPSDQYRNPLYEGYGYFQGEGYGYTQGEHYGYAQGEGNGYSQGDLGGWSRGPEFMGPQTRMYFMKRGPTTAKSVVFEEPESYQVTENGGTGYWHAGYSGNGIMDGGFFGYSVMGTRDNGIGTDRERSTQQQQQKPPPSPPLPPSISPWDYLNVFETYENGYISYFPKGSVHGSTTSSPDSKEVREREGIPELEDETESETTRAMYNELKKSGRPINHGQKFGEGTSKAVPLTKSRGAPIMSPPKDEGSINSVPSLESDSGEMMTSKERKSSASDTVVSSSPMEEHPKKKEVSFEVEEIARDDLDSPKLGSLVPLSTHGTRDVREVVREIRNEFEIASNYGKEVAMLLEVGKLPYQSRGTFLKMLFSRIIYLVAPSILSSHPPSRSTVRISARRMKAAALYFGDGSKDFNMRSLNISSTLEKLYVWEKKLYKEVKV
ncbi:hypothetical protein MLD38_034004 [Melastoma candidum]|uniref:Uncharacterized protein n=1 Tax=Melastoma candidum TaxID=119954 RepID=A0ACB9M9Y1_9MYRT|nr:hypothetical protein MLD38_034004 [Melastoma candidum]